MSAGRPTPASVRHPSGRARPGCRTLAGISLVVLYADAALRVLQGLLGDGFGPLLTPVFSTVQQADAPGGYPPVLAAHRPEVITSGGDENDTVTTPCSTFPPPKLAAPKYVPMPNIAILAPTNDKDACAKHEVLYGNLHADLAPWIDRQLRISEGQMRDAINMIEQVWAGV